MGPPSRPRTLARPLRSDPAVARLRSGAGGGGWRREWDSNSHASFRFCKLQIPHCRHCRKCHRCRGALPAIARGLSHRVAACQRSADSSASSFACSWKVAPRITRHTFTPTTRRTSACLAFIRQVDRGRPSAHSAATRRGLGRTAPRITRRGLGKVAGGTTGSRHPIITMG